MNVFLWVLSIVAVGTTAALAGVFWSPRPAQPEPSPPPVVADRLMRERLVVTLKSGVAFSGVLYEADVRYLALRAAVQYQRTPEGGIIEIPADGELFLSVADVDYIQRP